MISGDDNSNLEALSRSAGVDLVALRNKYSNGSNNGGLEHGVSSSSSESGRNLNQQSHVDANKELSKYKICQTCQGMGIVRSKYNHMMLEKTCEECDGDCIILQQLVENLVKDQIEKDS